MSHHLFIAPLIARLFATFKGENPRVVVVIGPNHYNKGAADVLASQYPYNTPWGVMQPEATVIRKLLKAGVVHMDEQPFEIEHSISALVGFVKHTFPDAKLVPIILKRGTTEHDAELLAQTLNVVLPEDSLVLASVDFSHHLNRIAASFHDAKSIPTLAHLDFESMKRLEVDSPASLYALLKYLDVRGAKTMEYQAVNSAAFSGNLDSSDVTSYLLAYFSKGAPTPNGSISYLHFGDAMFGRGVNTAVGGGNPFGGIQGVEGNFLRGTDGVMVNLEGPITLTSSCQTKPYSFKFDPTIAKLMEVHGIRFVNLANNHSFDCYGNGVTDTKRYLKEANIQYFGMIAGSTEVASAKTSSGRVAFVGFDDSSFQADSMVMADKVRHLKETYDYAIVNMHWGVKYQTGVSARQRNIAHALIDGGADLIIGHHPHVIGPVEVYQDRAIFYSLGNFIFDQGFGETNRGLGVGSVFQGQKQTFYLFPFVIEQVQPKLLSYSESEDFCEAFLKNIKTKDVCVFELSR